MNQIIEFGKLLGLNASKLKILAIVCLAVMAAHYVTKFMIKTQKEETLLIQVAESVNRIEKTLDSQNERVMKLELATISLSKGVEKLSETGFDFMESVIEKDPKLNSIYSNNFKRVKEIQSFYLPHRNGHYLYMGDDSIEPTNN